MVQTLIANSGIQFFSREILLDANDGFRQVFYEWFDEEQVEQVLEYAYEIRQLDKDDFGAGANYSRRTLMTFAFLEILAKYPANTDAKAILDKCVAMERKDYTDAVASQSVATLDAFMKKYPDSAFREDVADRIDDLPLWLKAKGQNTIDSYKRYLAESEHRIYKQEADDAIADLSTSQAYFNALRVNTIDALKRFRKDYPASSYDKRASSKIARLMADKFTSESSYADKRMAVEYAADDETIRYVSDKYATATRNNEAYSLVYKTSASQSRSSDASSRGSYRSSQSCIRFGLTLSADVGYSYDTGYEAYPFSIAAGGMIRFGDQRHPLNLIIGAKALMAYTKIRYDDSSYGSKESLTVNEMVIPVDLNWNVITSEYTSMYVGVGCQYGFQTSRAIKASYGFAWAKGDWHCYYIHYIKGMFKGFDKISPFLGMSYTYYF